MNLRLEQQNTTARERLQRLEQNYEDCHSQYVDALFRTLTEE